MKPERTAAARAQLEAAAASFEEQETFSLVCKDAYQRANLHSIARQFEDLIHTTETGADGQRIFKGYSLARGMFSLLTATKHLPETARKLIADAYKTMEREALREREEISYQADELRRAKLQSRRDSKACRY